MARKASDIIRGSIELGIELSLIISEKTVTDEAAREQMRKHARLQVEAIHANVAPLVQQMLDKMADEDPHTIASELLGTLDFDRNGKVTRDEFEQRFVESCNTCSALKGSWISFNVSTHCHRRLEPS